MTKIVDPPCTPEEAVGRAKSVIGKGGQYLLGTGDYRPIVTHDGLIDQPWTPLGFETGSDCAGFAISWCWKLRRHRPGFNAGPWSTVEDDINCNSMLEDAQHTRELGDVVLSPRPGDLLLYPTIYLQGHTFIGHVGLVVDVPSEWDPAQPQYNLLTIAQCHGPNHFKPGVVLTDGSIWRHHDSNWPKPAHRSYLVRPHTRS